MKSFLITAIALLCLFLAPAGAKADQQDDQSACMMDAQVYCGQFIPDRVRVAHCLMANRQQNHPGVPRGDQALQVNLPSLFADSTGFRRRRFG